MQIDELTEAMARAMDGGSQNNGDAVGPSLPPARAANAGKTVDEVWADLNKSPLFMTELEENDDTAALQALDYEGTPLENGGDFKVRGNECFKVRGYVDAKEGLEAG
ncbi:hypothetical protein HIM_00478 [Hirsutella minnesotensis 3608]|nr:hypothetical protein HIM_00478 [Hirsutella minnesotensis 3608]